MAVGKVDEDVVSESSVRSVQGAGRGLVKLAVGTTGQVFDLRKWAGRYVKLNVTGAFFYGFVNGTGQNGETVPAASALDITLDSKTVASTDETSGVPDFEGAAGSVHEVVPSMRPFLVVKAASGTVDVRVHRS